MKKLFEQALIVQNFLLKQKWEFCFIGGIALIRWGEPRLTQDMDITIFTGFGNEKKYIEILCDNFNKRIKDAEEFALKNRVLLLETDEGIPIDISLGGIEYERKIIKRASNFRFLENIILITCSAEDLIVLKAFADRTQDWADIEGIILRQGKKLDWNYIEKEITPLCELKESPHILVKLRELNKKLS